MKQYVYIKSWNGFSPSHLKNKTDLSDHYKKFYNLKKEVLNIDDNWLISKKLVAEDLASLMKSHKNILSNGCGRGIVEEFILKKMDNDVFIHGIDPYIDKNSQKESINLKLEKGSIFDMKLSKFDIVYMNTVDYCLTDFEYGRVCKRLSELSKNGLILSQLMPPDLNYLFSLKYRISTFIKSLPFTPYVFWGWHRSIDEHINILRNIGFKRFTFGYHLDNTIWIHAI